MASSDINPPDSPGRPQGRVRWRRFAYMLVPALGVAGSLIGLTAAGALTSSISVSGQAFTVTADQLQGNGFAQYGAVLDTAAGHKPVAVSVINSADLTNLCQSVTTPTPFGTFTLRLTAGGKGFKAVHADNMVVAADQLSGDATFHHIVIGQDASQLGANGVTPAPTPGGFGQMASDVTINGLKQNTWLTTAGTFSLPGLSLSFGSACP